MTGQKSDKNALTIRNSLHYASVIFAPSTAGVLLSGQSVKKFSFVKFFVQVADSFQICLAILIDRKCNVCFYCLFAAKFLLSCRINYSIDFMHESHDS